MVTPFMCRRHDRLPMLSYCWRCLGRSGSSILSTVRLCHARLWGKNDQSRLATGVAKGLGYRNRSCGRCRCCGCYFRVGCGQKRRGKKGFARLFRQFVMYLLPGVHVLRRENETEPGAEMHSSGINLRRYCFSYLIWLILGVLIILRICLTLLHSLTIRCRRWLCRCRKSPRVGESIILVCCES